VLNDIAAAFNLRRDAVRAAAPPLGPLGTRETPPRRSRLAATDAILGTMLYRSLVPEPVPGGATGFLDLLRNGIRP